MVRGLSTGPLMNHTMPYTRIVARTDGTSAFEDAEIVLTERQIAPGVPSMLVGGLAAAASVTFLRSNGFDSEPHPAPRRQWVMMLRGMIDVTVSDGSKRRFGPGDLVLAADTTGVGHVTVAMGEGPFEGLFVAAD